MSTIMEISTSRGFHARCDRRCYNARSAKCHCICGGLNHAVGRDQAIANTRAALRDSLHTLQRCNKDPHSRKIILPLAIRRHQPVVLD